MTKIIISVNAKILAILVPAKRLPTQIPKDVAYRYQKIPKDTKRYQKIPIDVAYQNCN